MNISFASTPQKLHEVHQFRYSVYVEEMNRKQLYADHSSKTIKDSLDDSAHTLVAYDRGKLIGTVRTNLLREGDVGQYIRLYGLDALPQRARDSISITSRLMISKPYRAGTLAIRLLKALFEFGLSKQIATDFMDCNPPLDGLFARLGYKPVQTANHPEYGKVVVMKLSLRDHVHLRSIASPFSSSLKSIQKKRKSSNA